MTDGIKVQAILTNPAPQDDGTGDPSSETLSAVTVHEDPLLLQISSWVSAQ